MHGMHGLSNFVRSCSVYTEFQDAPYRDGKLRALTFRYLNHSNIETKKFGSLDSDCYMMLANIEALFEFIKENKSLLVSRLLMTISH